MSVAVRCSKDLAGHWLLSCPWSFILASGPERNSCLYQVANVFMPCHQLSPSSEYHIPMSGISPSRKSSLDLFELDQSLLLFWHPKAMCYREKQVGFRAPSVTWANQYGPVELCNEFSLLIIWGEESCFQIIGSARNLWVPHCKSRAILGTISY